MDKYTHDFIEDWYRTRGDPFDGMLRRDFPGISPHDRSEILQQACMDICRICSKDPQRIRSNLDGHFFVMRNAGNVV